ncbi:cell death activator CIDE-A [Aquila chrysaetos chrysaetos]|nr:cell death activator CIDE-A [Aquila chrysaetos chrysaetos]XP_029868050.1 cell death activator CIDE-A [Aquila chrysaetos chrysaetos]
MRSEQNPSRSSPGQIVGQKAPPPFPGPHPGSAAGGSGGAGPPRGGAAPPAPLKRRGRRGPAGGPAMEAVRDCLGSLVRSLVSMGASVGAVTKQTLFPPLMPAGRPFRVSNASRSSRKGIVASSLQELISKTLDAFLISAGIVTLVLEEDGTVVDTEEFFKSLDDNTHFMVLEKGQKWTQTRNGVAAVRQKKKMGVANITFDLYKLNPKDFIGCLNIKATFYEIYSVSYDIKCMGAKSVLRKVLQLMSHAAQITGQFLLYTGTYMLQLMGEYDEDGTCTRSRRE